MFHSLLLPKRSLSSKLYFGTLVQSNTYCNNNAGIGKEDTLKETMVNDDVNQDKSLEYQLKRTFEKKMKNDAFRLFADFDTYKKWLPVRLIFGDFRKLYELPHYTNEHDLDILVEELEKDPENGASRDVKYFAAPPASGKTCAVLPAFLRSAEKERGFTHYIYIAFHNNHKRSFKAREKPVNVEALAYNQGAAFIVNCLKKILNDEEPDGADKEPTKEDENSDLDNNGDVIVKPF